MPQCHPTLKKMFGNNDSLAVDMLWSLLESHTDENGIITIPPFKMLNDGSYEDILIKAGLCAAEYLRDGWDYDIRFIK